MQRRSCGRFSVPGATVDWLAEAEPSLWRRDCPLRNLSRGGGGFLSGTSPRAGERVRLRITVPGEPRRIEVLAHVAWSVLGGGGTYHVGVEFAPYGGTRGANDPAVLERIEALETRFLRPVG